jgi:hypothetical protein
LSPLDAAPGAPDEDRPSIADALYRRDPSEPGKGDNPGAPDAFAGAPFDASKIALPEGYEPDTAALTAFASVARDLELDHAGASRLVAMHANAVVQRDKAHSSQVSTWANETRAYYGDALPNAAAYVREAIGDDADGREVLRLLDWSGLGSNRSVIKVLHRLALSRRS